ncbi:MAG: LysR family transcriptional regulator [Tissierella sp.]|uniref:LysR family transcriptional regulator n=1 Tax=Tissierella sp. TaxID=41274 RepID=UPI003F9C4BA6
MTLQQLRYVVAVHEAGSFSAASEKLYVSQPSISTMIADLESELDITIFNRSKKGVSLTEDGNALLQYAYAMLHLEDGIFENFKTDEDIIAFSVSSQHYTFAIDAFLHLEQVDRLHLIIQ